MKNIKILKKYFSLILIVFIINLLKSEQKYYTYTMETSIDDTSLEVFYINGDGFCEKWIPSLLYSIPIIDMDKPVEETSLVNSKKYGIKNPQIAYGEKIDMYLYYYKILEENFNVILAKPKSSSDIKSCYFGMSYKDEENNLNETYTLLNYLKNRNEISEKIFSFDKWKINNNNKLETKLYFGDSHQVFLPNNTNGIIGKCKTNKEDIYWGCTFNQMSFKENNVSLFKDTKAYKIYFSSESHLILFPKDFEESFNNITNHKCNYDKQHPKEDSFFLSCDDFFNTDGYASIKLIGDKMNITLEIDNVNRYNKGNKDNNKTRIRYVDNDYFVFPLIMFKNFHVQFDAKNDLISFYTIDKSILQVEEEKNQDKKKGTSLGLKVFLVILIIILVLALLFLGFWLYKKRKSSLEKNINKYNKFDEDENFQDMNEKRVF